MYMYLRVSFKIRVEFIYYQVDYTHGLDRSVYYAINSTMVYGSKLPATAVSASTDRTDRDNYRGYYERQTCIPNNSVPAVGAELGFKNTRISIKAKVPENVRDGDWKL